MASAQTVLFMTGWIVCCSQSFQLIEAGGVIDESQDENKPTTVCALWVLFQLVSVSDPS